MKTKTGILLIVFISILLITYSKVEMKIEEDSYGPKKALIVLDGKMLDTVYQHTFYKDGGARINEWDRVLSCAYRLAYATGIVNSDELGTYFVDYDGEDASGNSLSTVTRTVHVVKNSAAYLNGVYNVTCNCMDLEDSVITTSNYIASVSSGSLSNSFILNRLETGSGFVNPFSLLLKEYDIKSSFNHCDYNTSGSILGKLSASKNTFTIESKSFQFNASDKYVAKYDCINIFKNSKDIGGN